MRRSIASGAPRLNAANASTISWSNGSDIAYREKEGEGWSAALASFRRVPRVCQWHPVNEVRVQPEHLATQSDPSPLQAPMRHQRLRSALSLAAVTLLACGEPTTVRQVAGVSVVPASMSLVVGDSVMLIARAIDGEGEPIYQRFAWSSSDPSVATIEQRGWVTAVSAGVATMTVTSGPFSATAKVSVRNLGPAVTVSVGRSTLNLMIGNVAQLTAIAVDSTGRRLPGAVEWTSVDASVASVGRTDGVVTAIGEGTTIVTATAGDIRAMVFVTVTGIGAAIAQWAVGATASSEYTSDHWSARQATGPPNVFSCQEDPRAWASLDISVDWLEVSYHEPVRPSEIRIHEIWAVGAITRVEVKDISGVYHTVFVPSSSDSRVCPRILTIPVTSVMTMVTAIRITVDQTHIGDWTEIDAVQLIGNR